MRRGALIHSRGDFLVVVERRISAGLLAIATVLIVSMSLPAIARWWRQALAEQGS
jgi:TctA family transporter